MRSVAAFTTVTLLAGAVLFGQRTPRFTASAIGPDPSQSQEKIAPGIISTLYGHNLGPGIGCVAKEPYPTKLCGTQVFFGKLPAPLLYVQNNQINLRVPERTPEGTYSAVRVISQDRSSVPVEIKVARRIELPPLEEPGVVAEQIWRQWQAASRAAPYAEWKRRHTGVTCPRPPVFADGLGASQQWCYRCVLEQSHASFEWAFYAFTLRKPLACRLNRFSARVGGVSKGSLGEVYSALSGMLTREYGAADDPGRVHAQGSAYWRRLRRWRSDRGDVYLYLAKPLFEPLHLGLLARGQSLLDAMAQDHELSMVHLGPKPRNREGLGRDLIAALDYTASCVAGQGRGAFPAIIVSGERFLKEHPQSNHRAEVAFLVAQAYETRWSLKRTAGEQDEEARKAAIRYYREVVKMEPTDPKADYARRRLPRLILDINTNQHRFACSWD